LWVDGVSACGSTEINACGFWFLWCLWWRADLTVRERRRRRRRRRRKCLWKGGDLTVTVKGRRRKIRRGGTTYWSERDKDKDKDKDKEIETKNNKYYYLNRIDCKIDELM